MKVSKKAANLSGSQIMALAAEIDRKQAAGEQIHNLTIGDFDPGIFPIPETLEREIMAAYAMGETNYPGGHGLAALRETLSGFVRQRLQLDYSAEEFLITGGARPLIFAAYQALVDPGDKVLFPVPSWNNNYYTHLADGQKIIVETGLETNFMPTAEQLRPHIRDAALIALCSPLNPTGTTFRREQLEALCDLVLEENARRGPEQKPVYVIFDQIYWMLTYEGTEHFTPVGLRPEMKPYTIFVDGLSKAFAATGVRTGWGFGPKDVIGRMKAILGHVGAWSARPEQAATAKFLADGDAVDAYLAQFRAQLHERLQGFYAGFMALAAKGFDIEAIPPKAAIYLTLKINLAGAKTAAGEVLATQADVHGYLLDEAGLAIVPFRAFGAPDDSPWYRLSVGTAKVEDIPGIFNRLEAALAKLQVSVKA